MRFALLLAGFACLFSSNAFAQAGAMAAQRCIWMCNGATDGRQPAYNACIRKHCDDEKPRRKTSRRRHN